MPPATSRIERQITNLIRFGLDPGLFANGSTVTAADLEASFAKVAVFVDGCYWHGCPAHAKDESRTATVRARDAAVNATLLEHDWLVLRVWEHEEHLGPFIAKARAAITERSASRRADVLRHVASHQVGEWCVECEQWPHAPVPDGDDYCIRCDISSADHEYEPIELARFGPGVTVPGVPTPDA